jgi:hypothetical protein
MGSEGMSLPRSTDRNADLDIGADLRSQKSFALGRCQCSRCCGLPAMVFIEGLSCESFRTIRRGYCDSSDSYGMLRPRSRSAFRFLYTLTIRVFTRKGSMYWERPTSTLSAFDGSPSRRPQYRSLRESLHHDVSSCQSSHISRTYASAPPSHHIAPLGQEHAGLGCQSPSRARSAR